MGWLSNLFRKDTQSTQYAAMLNGYTPIFQQFGQDIFASDVVQQAISCIVQEMQKLNPQHVRAEGFDVAPVSGNIQTLLNQPNELMTKSEFIGKIIWQLYFNYNSFVIPTYYTFEDANGITRRHYTGLYPVQPTQVDFIEDATGTLFVKFKFANGYESTLRYSDVIHIRLNYSVSDFMGGGHDGQPDHNNLLKTLQINSDLLNGVAAAMRSSFSVNGVVKYKSMIDGGKTEAALKELEGKLKNSESGFLPLDLSADFIPIKKDIQMVDATTLKFIDEKILRSFGVPLPILTGDYTREQYSAFYQKTLEPLIIAMSQAFTKTLFTQREKSFGNKIDFYPQQLIFLDTAQTLEAIRMLGDSGALYENEKRVALGLSPLPELAGQRKQSLNYVDVAIAAQYQLNNKGGENIDDNEE